MAGKAAFYLKLAVFFGLLVVVVPLLVGGWLMWKRPLTIDAWMSRFALRSAGLETIELPTPDGSMTVWQGGAGPPMVMLHGAGDQAGAWARIVQPLVGRYRLHIPDLPGHWKSDPTKGSFGIDQVMAGLESVMDACCTTEPAILVGNSMGAWVAFLYAHDNPDRVARLVAVNGGPTVVEHPGVNLFPTNREEARETMRGMMGPNTPMPPNFVLDDVVRQMRTGPAARLAQRLVQDPQGLGTYTLEGRLDEVKVPVEMVWGDGDALFTIDYAQRMLDSVPASRLTIVKDCGHLPQRECPDRFLKAMNGVLAQAPPAPVVEADPVLEEG
jgi:pimeloyl-ACP methyl ester carboxylesterase